MVAAPEARIHLKKAEINEKGINKETKG